jgi:hypothetical protein
MTPSPVVRRLGRPGRFSPRVLEILMSRPADSLERVVEQAVAWWDLRRGAMHYNPVETWDEGLERLLGTPFPPDPTFDDVWGAVVRELRLRGLRVGRGVFGGWDDADVRLGRLAWELTRRLRPVSVVETGVARGLTTRVLLEALERNGGGRLWSIDRPPLTTPELATETGAAVPVALRHRWSS